MHHSYEALDRTGGIERRGLLAPLRRRDFRRLWLGTGVSLLGDGAFTVALAWQVYALSDAPTAMGVVKKTMTVPTIAALLLGGIASDRLDRRRVLLAADLLRLLAVGLLAVLSLSGELALWEVIALAAAYGAGQGVYAPAFDAFVPGLVDESELPQANAIDQMVRPVALRMAGPALGGVLTGAGGAGGAFGLDAASFALSALCVLSLRARDATPRGPASSPLADLRDGVRFLRGRAWLWVTFASAAVAYLLFMGPVEVLVPYLVKHRLHGGATELGAVFAAGGVASVLTAAAVGRRRLPEGDMTFVYVVWTLATLAVAGYGLGTHLWQLMLAGAAFNALETAGTVVWATLKQRHVPPGMLGRVSSLDWLISIGLLPLSFALAGPASAAFGAPATLVGAGLLGAAVTVAPLLIPGVRRVERAALAPA
jgi:DHA3 family tetracycline resistance protein-like MFS transporter